MKPCAGDSSRSEPSLKLNFCSRQINNNRGVRSDRRELLSPAQLRQSQARSLDSITFWTLASNLLTDAHNISLHTDF